MCSKKISLFIIVLLISVLAGQKSVPTGTNLLKRIQDDRPVSSLLNVNNISSWIFYDGISGHSPYTDDHGIFYPRGTAGIVFQDGIIWGGFVSDPDTSKPALRVGGQTYISGTTPGWILSPGTAVDPSDSRVRIYRIRSDWQLLSINDSEVIQDAAELNGIATESVTPEIAQAVLDQYETDWIEWPGDLGAPYIDQNGNEQWDSGIDIPGIDGADQVLWFVVNDLNDFTVQSLYGSPGIGLELQITMWGMISDEAVGQTIFRRYRIINKSGMVIDSMYIAQWSDVDIGDYTNDYVGCDPDMNLGYGYNGQSIDEQYQAFGLQPAALGYCLLQGPVVSSPGDTAFYNFKQVMDYKNLDMTSFSYFAAGSEIDDPALGEYSSTLRWYNLIRGFIPTTEIDDPTPYLHESGADAGTETKFPLNGDPVLRTGDIEGRGTNLPAGDRRMVIASGSFNMQPGDEQEMIIAIVGGIGNDYLQSLAKVKYNVDLINEIFTNQDFTSAIPHIFLSYEVDNLIINFSWNDVYQSYEDEDYQFLGYKIFQMDMESDSIVEVASFDLIDGISQIIDTINEKPVVVYSGQENGLQTHHTINLDVFTGTNFILGKSYYFAVQTYVYNPDAQPGKLVLSNDVVPVRVIFLPANYTPKRFADHISGNGDGSVIMYITDPSLVNNHRYRVTFHNDDDLNAKLTDMDLQIDIDSFVLSPGSNKMLFGSLGFELEIIHDYGVLGWSSTEGRWISGINWGGSHFFGALDIGVNFFGSTLEIDNLVNVRLEFQDKADVVTNGYISNGALYRRDLGFEYVGTGQLPFAAYDISNSLFPRRLNICFAETDMIEAENNASILIPANNIWDMAWHELPEDIGFGELGGREYLFIMNSDYDEGTNYNDDNWGPAADVLYGIWPSSTGDLPYLYDKFTMDIYSGRGFSDEDIFEFVASLTSDIVHGNIERPDQYQLMQNYPNPFNQMTMLTFILKKSIDVKLEIYNILGQKVKTLINTHLQTGRHRYVWDGCNDSGLPVSSGIYIYRIKAGNFMKVRKMLLIR